MSKLTIRGIKMSRKNVSKNMNVSHISTLNDRGSSTGIYLPIADKILRNKLAIPVMQL
jgi:hypothetical protein